MLLMTRHKYVVNTDPQRRCYNGANYSSETRWTEWIILERFSSEKSESRLKFWTELNDYAVKERGDLAKREFKLQEYSHENTT